MRRATTMPVFAPGWRPRWGSECLILAAGGVYFLAAAPFIPGLASWENLGNLLSNLLPLLVIAVGQTLVLIAGGIDLSATAIMAVTSVAGAMVMRGVPGHGPVAALAGVGVMLGMGTAVGWGNGFAITRLRLPAFMVTLTSMMFFSGLALWLTQSQKINGLPAAFNALGGNLAVELILTTAVVGLTAWGLGRLLAGRWLYAVGHNPRAALISGVPVGPVVMAAYAFSGGAAALGAVLLTGRGETGDPVLGRYLMLDVIGAAVLGGASFFGGRGGVGGTAAGVLFIKLVDNSLSLQGCSHFTIMMVKGGLILAAALADGGRRRLAGEDQGGRA